MRIKRVPRAKSIHVHKVFQETECTSFTCRSVVNTNQKHAKIENNNPSDTKTHFGNPRKNKISFSFVRTDYHGNAS